MINYLLSLGTYNVNMWIFSHRKEKDVWRMKLPSPLCLSFLIYDLDSDARRGEKRQKPQSNDEDGKIQLRREEKFSKSRRCLLIRTEKRKNRSEIKPSKSVVGVFTASSSSQRVGAFFIFWLLSFFSPSPLSSFSHIARLLFRLYLM